MRQADSRLDGAMDMSPAGHDAVQVGWSGIANTGPIAIDSLILEGLLVHIGPRRCRAIGCNAARRPGD